MLVEHSITTEAPEKKDWKTKPSDRFALKWIKCNLSARVTVRLARYNWLRPWMITVGSTGFGVLAGAAFAGGLGWLAGLLGGISQVLDGVDGQLARITGRESRYGAFMDSVLDRYTDGAMVIGVVVYVLHLPLSLPPWLVLLAGSAAVIGSNLVSYSSARAEVLGIRLGRPTLASKGTRMTVMVLSGFCTPIWPSGPTVSLFYLAIHPNLAVLYRLIKARR